MRDRKTPVARTVRLASDAADYEALCLLAAHGKVRLGGAPVDGSFWKLPAPRVRARVLKRALKRERDGD